MVYSNVIWYITQYPLINIPLIPIRPSISYQTFTTIFATSPSTTFCASSELGARAVRAGAGRSNGRPMKAWGGVDYTDYVSMSACMYKCVYIYKSYISYTYMYGVYIYLFIYLLSIDMRIKYIYLIIYIHDMVVHFFL